MTWNFANELSRYGPENKQAVSLRESQSYCKYVCENHYENFSVVSWLLPRELRPHFHSIYAYCRWSDDIADETGSQASELLNWWQNELDACFAESSALTSRVDHPVFQALTPTIAEFNIPKTPFRNLLIAFQQDQTVKEYLTFADLLAYCRNSANPVGHLVLYLFRCFDEERAKLSDEICTGLQLANFWQDVARDQLINRNYLPREDRDRFGYSLNDWQNRKYSQQFADLLQFEVERTQQFFERGKALLPLIPKRLRVDIDLFIQGGEAILKAITKQQYDVWSNRPQVSKWKKVTLLVKALMKIPTKSMTTSCSLTKKRASNSKA
jgi:squalene synthase HpnC